MMCLCLRKSQKETNQDPLWRRLAWFVGLWVASVLVVGVIAYGIKLLIK